MILFPMIRYMIFPDHVLEHDYVTYRLCMIPVLALNLLVEQRDGGTEGRSETTEKVPIA